ncbi:hypothetical protein BU25DRAFT_481074 [Macroventuria anomochaeta]|uniref:Uncharacterized protein n=1 Tax=Macroventuria anomochaeta TaxID=301207 RepID=A0ACB6RJD5_9PLEO|nr:uncharacterized protein BU25DRAFT_481074 [Macroventuria anomochaeta]KAF2622020.1 hypothetical protein BU25DRAFT_481074 [Macroventuria anomochaeta]
MAIEKESTEAPPFFLRYEVAGCYQHDQGLDYPVQDRAQYRNHSSGRNALPSRLIDIHDRNGSAPRLVLTGDNSSFTEARRSEVRYVALSYCWGKPELLNRKLCHTTTSGTPASYPESSSASSLTQDDPGHGDFDQSSGITLSLGGQHLHRSGILASVYGGAFLTVAASWSSFMHSGIFTKRPGDDAASAVIDLGRLDDATIKGRLELVRLNICRVDSTREPLFSRG